MYGTGGGFGGGFGGFGLGAARGGLDGPPAESVRRPMVSGCAARGRKEVRNRGDEGDEGDEGDGDEISARRGGGCFALVCRCFMSSVNRSLLLLSLSSFHLLNLPSSLHLHELRLHIIHHPDHPRHPRHPAASPHRRSHPPRHPHRSHRHGPLPQTPRREGQGE